MNSVDLEDIIEGKKNGTSISLCNNNLIVFVANFFNLRLPVFYE